MDVLGLIEVPTWLFLILMIVLLTFIHYQVNYTVFKRYGIPGPTPIPFIGNVGMFKHGMINSDVMLYKKYGKICGIYEGAWPTLFISDPDILKHILVKEFDTFTNRKVMPIDTNEMKVGMLNLENDHWRHIRTILSPTFTSGKLRQYSELINDAADTTLKSLESKAVSGEHFEAKLFTSAYTLDVIASTAFGVKTNSQTDKNDPFIVNALEMLNFNMANPTLLLAVFFPSMITFMRKLHIPLKGLIAEGPKRFFLEVTKLAMKQRLENSMNYKDFLQLIVNEHDDTIKDNGKNTDKDGKWIRKGLSTNEVLAQALIFFLAGYDTTGNTLTYLLYNLATNPQCMEQLIEEVDQELQGMTPNHDNVGKLTYMDQCLNETMRLYPPGFRFDRMCSKEITIKGLTIPANTTVVVPAWAIHHDPENFPDPEKFDPERFTKEESSKRNPFHFMPFGVGPRNCIGMRLALLEMKIFLVKIFQKYRVVTCEETQIPLKLDKYKFLKAEKGVWLKVEKREDNEQ